MIGLMCLQFSSCALPTFHTCTTDIVFPGLIYKHGNVKQYWNYVNGFIKESCGEFQMK